MNHNMNVKFQGQGDFGIEFISELLSCLDTLDKCRVKSIDMVKGKNTEINVSVLNTEVADLISEVVNNLEMIGNIKNPKIKINSLENEL